MDILDELAEKFAISKKDNYTSTKKLKKRRNYNYVCIIRLA